MFLSETRLLFVDQIMPFKKIFQTIAYMSLKYSCDDWEHRYGSVVIDVSFFSFLEYWGYFCFLAHLSL